MFVAISATTRGWRSQRRRVAASDNFRLVAGRDIVVDMVAAVYFE